MHCLVPSLSPGKGPQIPTKALSTQAKTSGKFSDPELDKLWRELLHHREKMREYNVLLEALSREEGEPCAMPCHAIRVSGSMRVSDSVQCWRPWPPGPTKMPLHMTGSLM